MYLKTLYCDGDLRVFGDLSNNLDSGDFGKISIDYVYMLLTLNGSTGRYISKEEFYDFYFD